MCSKFSNGYEKFAQLYSDLFENIIATRNGGLTEFEVFLFNVTGKIESRVSRAELLSVMKRQHDLIVRAQTSFDEIDSAFLG